MDLKEVGPEELARVDGGGFWAVLGAVALVVVAVCAMADIEVSVGGHRASC